LLPAVHFRHPAGRSCPERAIARALFPSDAVQYQEWLAFRIKGYLGLTQYFIGHLRVIACFRIKDFGSFGWLTEKPRVGGSILALATGKNKELETEDRHQGME
jgi:hypothetical protein